MAAGIPRPGQFAAVVATPPDHVERMNRLAFLSSRPVVGAFCASVALFSLWLRAGFPVVAIGPSMLDDALFVRLAQSLLAGDWLGRYDNATLAKGMFYPLFIAVSFLLNIPLKFAEHAFYLGVSAWLSIHIARRARSNVLGVVTFVLLALNPVMWAAFMARVVREGVYVTLTLLLIGLCVATLFRGDEVSRRRRLVQSAATGFAAGCFWLTREEGPWIIPSIAVCLAVAVLAGPRGAAQGTRSEAVRRRALSCLVLALPALAAFMATVGAVKAMNWRHYGVFDANEFHASSFQRGYGALARIRHEHWQRFVVFPADARRKAYVHSGAARELEPFLDGASGAQWKAIGCQQTQTTPCPEILSGWFMWALRDAVAQAGHYRSGQAAAAFYDRLADEIDRACRAGQIDCLPERRTLAPPFRIEYLRDMWTPARQLASYVFRMGEGAVGSVPSSGSTDQLALFAGMTGGRLSPAPAPAVISGWIASAEPLLELAVVDQHGRPAAHWVEYLPSPDVSKVFPSMKTVRFRIDSRCLPSDCSLRAGYAGNSVDAKIQPGALPGNATLRGYIDSISEYPEPPLLAKRQELQQAIARPIAHLYALLFPGLSVVAMAGLLLTLARPSCRQRHAGLLALAAACLAAVLVRIALLAYLDATSIPSANGSYAMPVSPMLVVFVVVGSWLALSQVQGLLGRPRNTISAPEPR